MAEKIDKQKVADNALSVHKHINEVWVDNRGGFHLHGNEPGSERFEREGTAKADKPKADKVEKADKPKADKK